ncbi:unnamed protein product [Hymenolepis diminuta]|uniref:Uncharacterized protein n=1 Tax=Hymenolepis diminuta TaxID=6216 RepID=A0A564Z4Q2_HYMDI|nr:unnamed protein product [Hymenolepis diminuta]
MRRCVGGLVFVLWIFLICIKPVYSFGTNRKDKILLISAEYVPFDIIISPDVNLSTFRSFINESCLLNEISLEDFNSSADVHSAILSGGLYHTSSVDKLVANNCDQIIRSKLSPHFEPLWLTNQRQGMKSGSFYWPDDFVAVNKSRPDFAVGSNPTERNAYFDTKMIHRWLLNPSITFMSIFIPPPPVLRDSEFMYNYVEYVDEFISNLLLIIKKSSRLNSSVSIIFIGGTAVVNNQNNFEAVPIRKIFKQWPVSAFGNHFKQARLLEFWPTPNELEEDDLRLLDEQNPDYFSCSTTEFRQQNPNLDTGLLPPYYLVAKSGKILQGKSFISVLFDFTFLL